MTKSYIDIKNEVIWLNPEEMKDVLPRLRKYTKAPHGVYMTYVLLKNNAPNHLYKNRVTVWRHKKILEQAGLL